MAVSTRTTLTPPAVLPRAGTDHTHGEENDPREVRPREEVFGRETGGAHHRDHIKQRFAETVFAQVAGFEPFAERDDRHRQHDEE